MLAFVCGVSLSGFFIVAIWSKWDENPIIVSLDTTAAIIDDVPFPALTVCNMNKMKRSAVERLTLRSVCSLCLFALATRRPPTTPAK